MSKSILIDNIEEAIKNNTPGWENTDAIDKINSILNQLTDFRISPANEKISSIREWVNILYSPRKSERYGGVDKVKLFIFHDCVSLRQIIQKIS